MPLEAAPTIAQLVATNPAHDDSLGATDAHLRLIKQALLNTFPAVATPITASSADLNATTQAPARLAALEASINNPQGNRNFPANVGVGGTLFADQVFQRGALMLPPGVICMWAGAVAAVPAGWALCDGRPGTPDLRDRFIAGAGGAYVAYQTGGVDLANVTSSATGLHSHGGYTGQSGAHLHGASTDFVGTHGHGGATGDTTLSLAQIPAHAHTVVLRTGSNHAADTTGDTSSGAAGSPVDTTASGGGGAHSHPISFDGGHVHAVTVAGVADHGHPMPSDGTHSHTVSFDNKPLYLALAFIIKL